MPRGGPGSSSEAEPEGTAGRRGLELLHDLADAVARATDVEDVYREAVRLVGAALGVDRASLLVYDDAGIMRFRAWQGLSEAYRAATEGHSPWPPGERDPLPVLIDDIVEAGELESLRPVVLAEGIRALAFVPVVAAGRLLGKFMLYHDVPHAFSRAEIQLASTIAASVATAIERMRMEDELRTSRDQMRAVFEGVADGITVLDRDGRLVLANTAAAQLCGLESAEQMLELPGSAIMDAFEILDEHGRPLDAADTPGRRVLAGEPFAEMVLRYRPRGTRRDRWSEVKATPIHGAQGEVRFAVSLFRDVTRERREAQRQRVLARTSAVLAQTLDLPTMLDQVAALVVPEFADWCAVHVLETGRAPLLALAHSDPERLRWARELTRRYPPDLDGERGLGRVLRTGRPEVDNGVTDELLAAAAQDEEHLALLRQVGIAATMIVPIVGRERPLGAIAFVSSDPGRTFSDDDLALATELASSAALAVANGQLHAAERAARESAEAALARLAKLTRIADAALGASSTEALLNGLLESVRDVLESDRAAILLLDGPDDLVIRAAVGIDEDVASRVRVPVGEGVAGTIAATRMPRVIDDLSEVDVVSAYLREHGGSLAGVPLVLGDRLLGVLHVSSDRLSAFDTDDLELLRLAAERAAVAIEQTRLFEHEHEVAAALQRGVLPERFPRLAGVALAASYLPATDGMRVGGDWYDAFPVGDGRVALAIGDVVGHGLEAAAAMGQIRNGLRAYALEDPSPREVLRRLNALLAAIQAREFCTAFYAVLDPWSGSLVYANAGHPSPLVVRPSGESRFLDGARSTPLGVFADARFEEEADRLDPGSVLFAYTDGLVERRDEALDDRLSLLARELGAASATTPLRRLPDVVASKLLGEGGQRLDDVAVIAAQVSSSPEQLSLRVPARPESLVVVRRALDAFLSQVGATPGEAFELKVACGEACANAIEHAYGSRTGTIRVSGAATEAGVELSVRDAGTWRAAGASRADRGRGLALMRSLVDDVRIELQEPTGTQVKLVRRLGGGAG